MTGYAWLIAGCSRGVLTTSINYWHSQGEFCLRGSYLLFFSRRLVNRPWLADLPKQSYAVSSVLNTKEPFGGRKGSVGTTTCLPIDIAF